MHEEGKMKKTLMAVMLILMPCLVLADVTVTMKMKTSGMMGMLNTDWNEKIYSKPDRMRTESIGKAMGMGGMAQEFDRVEITRLDKGLVWLIDNKDSTYSEIKIDEPLEVDSLVEFSIKDLKVTKTDNKRTVAGYECKEVKVEFTAVFKTEESAMEQKIKGTLWIAKEDEKLKEVNRVWETGWASAGKRMGKDLGAINRQIESVMKEVGGVPLATEMLMEMGMGGMEQGEDEEYKQAVEMMKKFMKERSGKGQETKDQAEESFGGMKITTEMTSISIGKLSDNLFELPKNYKKVE